VKTIQELEEIRKNMLDKMNIRMLLNLYRKKLKNR